MKARSTLVAGGGPSGLYFAYLLKKARPSWPVRVVEQNSPDATFGFGVTLADRGLARLQAADPESALLLVSRCHLNRDQTIVVRGEGVLVDRDGYGGAIGRLELLHVLQGLCRDVGVELEFERRVESLGDLDAFDLVVGADGVNSTIRSAHACEFGTSISRLSNRFAWYGTRARFERAALSFKHFRGGSFCGHYYPYSPDMGTFVAECDELTWQRLELESMSDEARQALIEEAFRDELMGHPLVYNKSVWRQFPVVVNERWHTRNRVLIGDALHSAHFSIGSGTRIAMEDAIALWEAVLATDSIADALPEFQRRREPSKTKLLDAARASYTWYETFPQRMDALRPLDFVYDFMTRTGRLGTERLRAEHPGFMARYEHERRLSGAVP